MDDVQSFKLEVERFLKKSNYAPTMLGKNAGVGSSFVTLMRIGREPRIATRKKVLAFIKRFERSK